MGLRILHSADWHLGAAFSGFSPEQRQQLIRSQRQLPGRMADLVRAHGCHLVLLAGDLFDVPCPKGEWVQILQDALARMKVPVFISPGNHDYCCPGSPWLEESWPENVHIFTGGLTPVDLPQLDCRIWGAGYQSMDCPPLLEGFRAEGPQRYKIGLLHGTCMQPNSPYCPISAQQIASVALDLLALGHIHKGGILRKTATLCAWPGCPMGRGWDETGEKGLFLVDLGEKTPEVTPIFLDTPTFYDLEAEETSLSRILPPAGNDNFYRITLIGDRKTDIREIRENLSHFPNLTLIDTRETPEDLWKDAGEDTLRGEYFRLLREQNALLTAEISRKLLQGKEVNL